MKLKSDAKRLGVFVFFDRDSIVDDYVVFMLDSLSEAVDDMIIVSNSSLDYPELAKLLKYTDDVIIRRNVGLDTGAFKEVYDLKGESFKNYDELILMNDTFYGPFKPFKDIVGEMASKDLDFWGLSANYDSVDGYNCLPDRMIHSHIQTFFVAYRNNVLISDAYNNYWKKYDVSKMQSFFDVVTKHEIAFTYYLEQYGFKWDIYSDLSKFRSNSIEGNFNCYAYVSYDMIKNCNFPIVKRKNFVFDKKEALYLTDGADARRSLDYLRDNNLYDVDMIWKNLVRLYKPEELYYGLNLDYVIDEAADNSDNSFSKCAVIFVLNRKEYVKKYVNIINDLSIKNIFVISNDKFIRNVIKNNDLNLIEIDDFEPTKYEYICLINDFYFESQKIISAYDYNLLNIYNNALVSKYYINSIVKIFECNKYIAGLVVPASYHSNYYAKVGSSNNVLSNNMNCVWIKSELYDASLLFDTNFVYKYICSVKKSKKVVGKIFNIREVNNVTCVQAKIIKELCVNLRKSNITFNNTFIDSLIQINNTQISFNKDTLGKKIKKGVKRFIKKK